MKVRCSRWLFLLSVTPSVGYQRERENCVGRGLRPPSRPELRFAGEQAERSALGDELYALEEGLVLHRCRHYDPFGSQNKVSVEQLIPCRRWYSDLFVIRRRYVGRGGGSLLLLASRSVGTREEVRRPRWFLVTDVVLIPIR